MAKFAVILPAAGQSSRFQFQKRKKPFVELKGRAIWLRSLEPLINRTDVAQTLVVISPDDMAWFKEKFAPNLAFLNLEIVPGGNSRADSVRHALARVRGDIDFVAVHDAARPLIVGEWIDRVFTTAEKTGAALLASRVTSTLKRSRSDGTIETTVSRDGMWQAQTPQVFRRDWLLDAYAKWTGGEATDESQMLERAGYAVTLVEGSPLNFKVTTHDDFRMAEACLDALPKPKLMRPLHPFADENPGGLFD